MECQDVGTTCARFELDDGEVEFRKCIFQNNKVLVPFLASWTIACAFCSAARSCWIPKVVLVVIVADQIN